MQVQAKEATLAGSCSRPCVPAGGSLRDCAAGPPPSGRGAARAGLAAITCGLALLMGACGSGELEDAVSDAVYSTNSAFLEGMLLSASIDPMAFNITADQAAQRAVKNAPKIYQPKGCVTATADGATTSTELQGCTGPRGLVEMTGEMTVIYAVGTDGLHARLTAHNFSVNKSILDLNAEGTYSRDEADVVLDVITNVEGTVARGRKVARRGGYTMRWNPAEHCLDLDGEWDTTVGIKRWSTTVAGLRRCAGRCPSAGTITYEGEDLTITITFDGSSVASWTTSREESGWRPLPCVP